jgi:pyruvate/2-oxoglutarate dehydrogenase complex dihydrolipoamide acyltransferase (E2) component
MQDPLVVPELGVGDESLQVSGWLIEPGEDIEPGDRLVEILCDGLTFDVSAKQTGVLARIERPLGAAVRVGDVLGWIETGRDDR